jgi:hypothetical protein
MAIVFWRKQFLGTSTRWKDNIRIPWCWNMLWGSEGHGTNAGLCLVTGLVWVALKLRTLLQDRRKQIKLVTWSPSITLTNQLILQAWVLKKLTIPQLETRQFRTMFKTASHSTSSHSIYSTSILITSHLWLGLLSGLLPSVSTIKILYVFRTYTHPRECYTAISSCPPRFYHPCGEENVLWSSSPYNLLSPYFSHVQIFSSAHSSKHFQYIFFPDGKKLNFTSIQNRR